jgi:catechol 2,3-dioxygenase-like lactoylglutathione lyase family enzyme
MIRGVHTMFYSTKADELRAFLRDKLGFSRCTDVGGGWLIFDLPEADMGVHPTGPNDPHAAPSGTHAISFYCDDIHATVEQLKAKGVEFIRPIEDHGYGFVTFFKVPGDFELQLYQPKYQKR